MIQLQSDIPLRYYQSDAIQAVLRARRKRHIGLLIVLPTGTGKTITFGGLSRAVNGRTLVMAHRNELLQQALDKIQMVWPDVSVGIVRGVLNEVDAQVVAGSVATLRNPKRMKSYLSAGVPDLVIIDEAHHAVSSSYRSILTAIRAANPHCTIVGVTATPNRGDGVALNAVFDRVVYQKSLWTMVRQGFLVDLIGYRITLPIPKSRWAQLRTVGGDYVDADVDRIMNVAEVNEALVDGWMERMRDAQRDSFATGQMSTVVFGASIGHAERLAEAFNQRGISATVVHSKLKDEERARRLRAFHEGQYTVVTTVAVLTEGWDEPAIRCVMIARPTRSPALYLQMVGRGTRTFPNKYRCLVLDVTPEDVAPDVCQLGSALAGRPLPEGTSIREAMVDQVVAGDIVRDQEGMHVDSRDEEEPTAPAGIAAFDPFDKARLTWVFVKGRDGRQMRFVRADDTTIYWVVPRLAGYPAHDESWVVMQSRADKASREWAFEPQGRPLLTEYAHSLVDQKARSALTARNAKWRMNPASEKQLAAIRSMGGDPGPALTQGGASDWINELTKESTAQRLMRWLATSEGQAVD